MDLNAIENLNIDRVLKRGTAEIIEKESDSILLRDTRSKVLMLACDDVSKGMEILERNISESKPIILITNPELGRMAAEKFGYEGIMECYQMAYYSEEPPKSDNVLTYKTATMDDYSFIAREYELVSEEELKELIERGNIIMGYEDDNAIGFIGEHLEGSVGLLQVLSEHRRKGYGMELEKEMIRRTIERGDIPFGQVVVDNTASLELQNKLGLTKSEGTIFWMW
ncbi:MAG: GNAT family N-acetyltransferase [Butyrivibrio sp.]|nr:GNAT family N-acetyltransferase [Butyrivibrio sp.]